MSSPSDAVDAGEYTACGLKLCLHPMDHMCASLSRGGGSFRSALEPIDLGGPGHDTACFRAEASFAWINWIKRLGRSQRQTSVGGLSLSISNPSVQLDFSEHTACLIQGLLATAGSHGLEISR